MGIKVYTSGLSGSHEIKKKQQRILLILDSKGLKYDEVDISRPDQEEAKLEMREKAKAKTPGSVVLPPQVFKDDVYCGDYDEFELANENDQLFTFLKLEPEEISNAQKELENNRITSNMGSRSSSETPEDKKETKAAEETTTEAISDNKEELHDGDVSSLPNDANEQKLKGESVKIEPVVDGESGNAQDKVFVIEENVEINPTKNAGPKIDSKQSAVVQNNDEICTEEKGGESTDVLVDGKDVVEINNQNEKPTEEKNVVSIENDAAENEDNEEIEEETTGLVSNTGSQNIGIDIGDGDRLKLSLATSFPGDAVRSSNCVGDDGTDDIDNNVLDEYNVERRNLIVL